MHEHQLQQEHEGVDDKIPHETPHETPRNSYDKGKGGYSIAAPDMRARTYGEDRTHFKMAHTAFKATQISSHSTRILMSCCGNGGMARRGSMRVRKVERAHTFTAAR